MKYKITVALLTLVFSMHLLAEAENTPPAIPRNLHIYNSSGYSYVDLVSSGCSSIRYVISPLHVKYDAIMSILLAAQVANREVVIRFDGCNTLNQGQLVGVYLQ